MGEECKCKAVVFSFLMYREFSDNALSYMLAACLHALILPYSTLIWENWRCVQVVSTHALIFLFISLPVGSPV